MKKILTSIAALALSASVLSGCGEMTSKDNSFYCMHTLAQLVISDNFNEDKGEKFGRLSEEVENKLFAIENSISSSVANSCISKFNSAEAGATVEIDETAYEVLTLAKKVYNLTEGYYNPAVYYNVSAYGFKSESYTIPPQEEIDKYNSVAEHFGELELEHKNNSYYAVKPAATFELNGEVHSMKIDLGGIGKGYATDIVNALIDEYGFKNGSFSFGGSSITCKKFKGGKYTLNLNNPRAVIGSYASVEVQDTNLSTSGDYQQYFEEDGVRYCHVFDPTTGKPVQTGIMSATVIGGSAAEGDALTTALMAMGKDKAVEFINKNLSNFKVVFTLEEDGCFGVITNIPDELKNLNEYFKILNTVSDGKIILGE